VLFDLAKREIPLKSCSGKSAADNSQKLHSGTGDASQELFAHGQSGRQVSPY